MKYTFFVLIFFSISLLRTQVLNDNFDNNSTIQFWYSDDCILNLEHNNPFPDNINSSAGVLRYEDVGGQYANVGFNSISRIMLANNTSFSLKIYVPSNSISGGQPNQISLKLQNANLAEPWTTQAEIIKPIELDMWQTVEFNFASDPVLHFDNSVAPPLQRTDFNRVVLQVNGENNNDPVVAYIDDFSFSGTNQEPIVYDYLVWGDEFNEFGPLNSSRWFHQTLLPNGNSWYNNEVQHYTNRIDNSYMEFGRLKLIAKKETFTNQGVTKEYTSARLNSKFAFTYGRVEVRAKMPTGAGTWPAIWMLGKNISEPGAYWQTQGFGSVSWPACGEIDIMEHWGNNQNFVQSAMHTPSSFGATVNHGGRIIPTVSDSFHVYILDWYPDKMVFSVDGIEHYTYQPSVQNSATWPFNKDQYLLLNIAIEESIAANFTSSAMEVDYVRVFQQNTLDILEQPNVNNWSASPNPTKDILQISIDHQDLGATLEVIDLQGRSIHTEVLWNSSLILDSSKWLPGVYFVRNLGTSNYKTIKVVKE